MNVIKTTYFFVVRLGISYVVHQSLLLTMHAKHNTQLLDSRGRKCSRRHGDLVLLQILNDLLHSGNIFRVLGVVGSIPFDDLFFAESATGIRSTNISIYIPKVRV